LKQLAQSHSNDLPAESQHLHFFYTTVAGYQQD
jgi:hypothetical protein